MYDMSILLPGYVLLGGIIALIACAKLKKKKLMMPVGIVAGLLFIGSGIYTFMSMGGEKEDQELDTTPFTMKYYQSVGEKIGNEVTGKCLVEKKAFILAENKYYDNKFQSALVDQLSKNIEMISEAPVVDFIRINKKKEKYTAEQFDDMLRKHWYCDLMISLEGLPEDLYNMTLWKKSKKKRPNVVIYTDSSNISNLKEYLKKKLISFVICRKPGDKSKLNDEPPEDMSAAFNKHFILVTPSNMGEMATKYKDLF